MYKIYAKSTGNCLSGSKYFTNTFFGGNNETLHVTLIRKFPQVALALPTNVVDINASEIGRFSPLRERDISGPVINSFYQKKDQSFGKIDITVQSDPRANKYDCRGAVSLSSSMQSNVPSPFSGNHTHLGMPGSQWGQGYKYLSDHLHGAHYLTLRNEYRENLFNKGNFPASCEEQSYCSETIVAPLVPSKYYLLNALRHIFFTIFGVDLVAILQKLDMGEGIINKITTSGAGTFVIAYAVHKVFAPVRMAITLTATPFIVRYLRKTGIIKNK